MLATSPGMWVTDEKIALNGNEGVRVMINERIQNMTTEQLIIYLKSIDVEDSKKIEIIPVSGADYDADSRAGIVKITLKKRRDDGIQGSLGIRGSHGQYGSYTYSPSANINYRRDKLQLYSNLYYMLPDYSKNRLLQSAENLESGEKSSSTSWNTSSETMPSISVGGIYDFNDKHSAGAEFYITQDDEPDKTNAFMHTDGTGYGYDATSLYNNYKNRSVYMYATANYVAKLDSLGSTFRFIGNFSARRGYNHTNYRDSLATSIPQMPVIVYDTLYRSLINTDYKVYSATADYNKRFATGGNLKAGLKFTYNDTRNRSLYDYNDLTGGGSTDNPLWRPDGNSRIDNYVEQVAAAYAVFSSKIKNVSFTVGLRAEYTNARPRSESVVTGQKSERTEQSYIQFFPNANIMVPLNKTQSNSLILSYGRTITRPSFWGLTPFRLQTSANTYIIGNPDLKPTITDAINLTAVFAYKYSVTAGVQFISDNMRQIISLDDSAEQTMYKYSYVNISGERNYYVTVDAPFNITKWWNVNAGALYMYMEQKLEKDSPKEEYNMLMARLSMNFTLPKKFFVELTYSGILTSVTMGNMSIRPTNTINASVKKRLLDDRLTLSIGVDNIVSRWSAQHITASGVNFSQKTIQKMGWNTTKLTFSARYNFLSGKSFNTKSVERGEDDTRLKN
jgi:outer membrane receptor protein involved in Fe transport